jgi:hypothetical protein
MRAAPQPAEVHNHHSFEDDARKKTQTDSNGDDASTRQRNWPLRPQRLRMSVGTRGPSTVPAHAEWRQALPHAETMRPLRGELTAGTGLGTP